MNVLKEMNSLTVKDKDNLEESIDDEEEIEDKYEDEYDALIDDLDNLVDRLEDHQLEYGGLVRLRF